MPPPNDAPSLPAGAHLTGGCISSAPLVQLLVTARSGYPWPRGTSASASQLIISRLEATVSHCLTGLNSIAANQIVVDVSRWAGNNAKSHALLVRATPAQQAAMQAAITDLVTPGREHFGIDALCALPGISLVIASKIFRFCAPQVGAAVDRHASYFFNSLPVVGRGMATTFRREWSNGRHTSSRLATFSPRSYADNRDHYFQSYLPVRGCIANALNAMPAQYNCAATNRMMNWTPADVEMAAYSWWACNGAR